MVLIAIVVTVWFVFSIPAAVIFAAIASGGKRIGDVAEPQGVPSNELAPVPSRARRSTAFRGGEEGLHHPDHRGQRKTVFAAS
ncbi:hypothetical protein SMNI109538_18865 [Smaragdicoccus niigatensis]